MTPLGTRAEMSWSRFKGRESSDGSSGGCGIIGRDGEGVDLRGCRKYHGIRNSRAFVACVALASI